MEAIEMAVMEYPDSNISVNPCQGKVDAGSIRRANNNQRAKNSGIQESISGAFNEGYELISGTTVAVPNEDLFFGYANKRVETQPSTNGIASGNTFEEANISAIYELIERHLIVQNPLGRELELGESFFDINEHLKIPINKMRAKQMTCKVFFLGSLAGVFVFRSEVIFPIDEQDKFGTGPGWGSHSNPIIAINRSLAEAIQIISAHKAILTGLTPVTEMQGGAAVSAETQKAIGNQDQFYFINRMNFIKNIQICSKNAKCIKWDKIMQSKKEIPEETELENLIRQLANWGIRELVSVKLSSDNLPFAVVRCFSREFNAPSW